MVTKNESSTPWTATHPGTILRYELEERNISQKDFAAMIGMQKSHLNELIRGKRPMTKPIADKIEEALGISSVSLVNMQTQYDHDLSVIEKKGEEELVANATLSQYNEAFDIKTLLKRLGRELLSAVEQVKFLADELRLPEPAELKMATAGMFKKSAKTGQDARMLMTWKILAESQVRSQNVRGQFSMANKDALVAELAVALHANKSTEQRVKEILSEAGIAFCIVEKMDKASVDGYSFIEDGIPCIVLTKRYDRIDNFAFALLHEVGHIFLHYAGKPKIDCKLSIPDYDHESPEEKAANEFAANALIPDEEWKNAPKVRVNPIVIQQKYTQWANQEGLNKWIVLGRISYETGMYKFRSDGSRNIG